MHRFTLILSALFFLAMVVVMAPSIVAMNRGKALRNIALWLAIFFGLALFYRTVGPGSPHPLFNLPQAMQRMQAPPAENANPVNSNQGYTPPKD